ncbi:hypothetical protein C8J56DRAFT_1162184, partial [Mycena floridula]
MSETTPLLATRIRPPNSKAAVFWLNLWIPNGLQKLFLQRCLQESSTIATQLSGRLLSVSLHGERNNAPSARFTSDWDDNKRIDDWVLWSLFQPAWKKASDASNNAWLSYTECYPRVGFKQFRFTSVAVCDMAECLRGRAVWWNGYFHGVAHAYVPTVSIEQILVLAKQLYFRCQSRSIKTRSIFSVARFLAAMLILWWFCRADYISTRPRPYCSVVYR